MSRARASKFLASLARQKAEARKTMLHLAKLFPHAFDEQGRPIVASAHFPKIGRRS